MAEKRVKPRQNRKAEKLEKTVLPRWNVLSESPSAVVLDRKNFTDKAGGWDKQALYSARLEYAGKDIAFRDSGQPHLYLDRSKFADLDTPLTAYSTPFSKFANISAMTRTRVSGGSAPLSFAELLSRVTARSVMTEGLPISDSQLGSMLKKYGYELTTTLDNITMRQYTASRNIPAPADAK